MKNLKLTKLNDDKELSKVIKDYTKALDLLDNYDHQTLVTPKGSESDYVLTYEEVRNIIDSMKLTVCSACSEDPQGEC